MLKQQDKAFDVLNKAGLNKEQKVIVDRTISAASDCGAAYSAVAYELGLQNRIKFISEQKRGERMGNINEQIAKAGEEIRKVRNTRYVIVIQSVVCYNLDIVNSGNYGI